MTTIHYHQAEIIDYDERECDYIAAIETQTTEHGLQTYTKVDTKADNIISELSNVVNIRKPEVVIIESTSVSEEVLECITGKADYVVYYDMLNAGDYGIPQSRKRKWKGEKMENIVPIWEKYTLTIEESAVYFNIGEGRLRTHINENKTAGYILWKGSRPNIKRKEFEKYIDSIHAYNDFMKCYEIDPDNKDVWDALFKIALTLFQKTNLKEYYDVAKTCIKKLREDIDTIDLLSQKFNALEMPKETTEEFDPNKLLARIDEKIADLSMEEAQEHIRDSAEYGNIVSEALEHYNSSLKVYKELYSKSKNEEYWISIERVRNKIAHIENPEHLSC